MELNLLNSWATDVFRNAKVLDIIIVVGALYFISSRVYRGFRRGSTKLPGPPSESLFFGLLTKLFQAQDQSLLFEEWADKYGPVFRIPLALGSSNIILADPKAVAYFFANETTSFRLKPLAKIFIELLFGRGLIWAEGDSHKRQRKALTPGFSNQAIRALTGVFFDSAYKLKTAWDATLHAAPNGQTLIDVQGWMNKVSLDTIGIAGFSHDFGTLQGRHSKVAETFDSFIQIDPKGPSYRSVLRAALMPLLPLLAKLPTGRIKVIKSLNETMGKISHDLLARMRDEKGASRADSGKGPKSLIETLILAEGAESQITLSEGEVLAQMKTLILAGYETTSISLTWALIDLCLHPKIQDHLRAELSQLSADPTFEQLSSSVSLPLLDAVTKEVLRLHPPVGIATREAVVDEIIPLSTPLTTRDGKVVDQVHISAGATVIAPLRLLNKSKAIWGENAHEFVPERWLSSEANLPEKAKEIHGWSHMLTFIDGPRTCLGRQFAIVEFKAVLSTLIRHYEFELPNGDQTKFEKAQGILPRPRVAGGEGSQVPMLVKRVD